jgi:hypothetical protein
LKAGFESENFWSRADAAHRASGRQGCRRQPAEETPGQPTAVVENDAARDGLAIAEHGRLIAHQVPSLRAKRSNPAFCVAASWIASSQGLLAMTFAATKKRGK